MISRDPSFIEKRIQRTAIKIKWLAFLQKFGLLGSITTFLFFLIGLSLHRGLMVRTGPAVGVVVLVILGALATLIIFAIIEASKKVDRTWLARKLEESDEALLDSLNTVVFLQKGGMDPNSKVHWLYPRIVQQASSALKSSQKPVRLPVMGALAQNGIFVALLIGTIYFYHRFDPWEKLNASPVANNSSHDTVDIALPDANSLEQKAEWGEVRFTEPGHDLKVTKVDAVQFQIEAVSNQKLASAEWLTAVNGNAEQTHALPAPTEPKYAAYQPILYVDEYHLNTWDVVTYYARAATESGLSYSSDVYFLEVRPFREDILKMPGGNGGKAYNALSQITDLINRQQNIVRQTYRHIANRIDNAKMETQDREKLASAEADLSDAAKHLYAMMTVKMENAPIGEALDLLVKADASLSLAVGSLTANQMTDALNQEREALRQLIETRKMFQKVVSDHPNDFKDDPADEDSESTSSNPDKKLQEMAEFRNEEKAAQELVKGLIARQKKL
ncbi:MAG: hypothetical protein JWN25_731, partial [Verrucomicrobiales bacterium]|nr:hypothetical protein [Verrucomicrobiales bacterium]